jgi:hypothetical protein
MRTLNQQKIARTNPDDSGRGDGPKTDDSRNRTFCTESLQPAAGGATMSRG